jgi:hypothetical protein
MITSPVSLVLGQRTGAHREDCLLFQKRVMFYYSWARGLVFIARTACYSRNVLYFTGLGPVTSSPHDEHQSSSPRPVKHNTFLEQQAVLTMSTGPPAQDQ